MKTAIATTIYLQSVYIHSANWCKDWVLWLGEGLSLVSFRSYYGYEPGGERAIINKPLEIMFSIGLYSESPLGVAMPGGLTGLHCSWGK
jgi:hypothetical protein